MGYCATAKTSQSRSMTTCATATWQRTSTSRFSSTPQASHASRTQHWASSWGRKTSRRSRCCALTAARRDAAERLFSRVSFTCFAEEWRASDGTGDQAPVGSLGERVRAPEAPSKSQEDYADDGRRILPHSRCLLANIGVETL